MQNDISGEGYKSFIIFEKKSCKFSDDFMMPEDSMNMSIPDEIWSFYGGEEIAKQRKESLEELCILDECALPIYMAKETAEWLAFYKLIWEKPKEWRIPSRNEIKYRAGTAFPQKEKPIKLMVPPPTQIPSLNFEKAHGLYREPKLKVLR